MLKYSFNSSCWKFTHKRTLNYLIFKNKPQQCPIKINSRNQEWKILNPSILQCLQYSRNILNFLVEWYIYISFNNYLIHCSQRLHYILVIINRFLYQLNPNIYLSCHYSSPTMPKEKYYHRNPVDQHCIESSSLIQLIQESLIVKPDFLLSEFCLHHLEYPLKCA